VQAYRWFSILLKRQSSADLERAAKARLKEIEKEMSPQEIALAEALTKYWAPKRKAKKEILGTKSR
jgi:hypothetical protein